jgi:hypothetical protein
MMASRTKPKSGTILIRNVDLSGQVLVAILVTRWYNCVFNVKGEL